MKNIDKLKAKIAKMNAKKLAEFIAMNSTCDYCPYVFCSKECNLATCSDAIKQWLKQEYAGDK